MAKRRFTEEEKRIITERYNLWKANRPKEIIRDFNLTGRQQLENLMRRIRANPTPPRASEEGNSPTLREGHSDNEAPLGARLDDKPA